MTQRREFGFRLRRVDVVHPTAAPRQRPHRQQCFFLSGPVQPTMQASPPPLLGTRRKIRTQRVPLDVACDRIKVLVFLDRKGLEASLVEMARAG